MERVVKVQALHDTTQSAYMASKKNMQIKPVNSIIASLRDKADADQSENTVKDLIWILYDTPLLTSGFSLYEPATFSAQIHHLVKMVLSIDDSEEEYEDNMEDLTPLDGDEDEGEYAMEMVDQVP